MKKYVKPQIRVCKGITYFVKGYYLECKEKNEINKSRKV